MKDTLKAGVTVTRRFTVDRDRTIDFMGDELRVYATPDMARDVERTCRDMVFEHLDDGEDTVGARIEVDHIGATLMDMWVDITATITEVDGRRVMLEAEVKDALDTVGKIVHTRFVIDMAKQKERLEAKAAKAKDAG